MITPPDRLTLEAIRADQARLRELVGQLDQRIDTLSRRFDAPEPAPPPSPLMPRPASSFEEPALKDAPPKSIAKPPPLPTVPGAGRAQPPPPTPPAESGDARAEARPPGADEPLELRVGTYWMARIGIVILLTGLVFLGNYAYQQIVPLLGALGKLSLLALAGVALGAAGAWLERSRESMRNYGRVLLAGGAATIYYTAYAAHFVERLRVIESPVLGGGLLLALAALFIWHADRRRSEALALPAVVLAYYTSSINAIGSFTLFSNLLLTGAAVFFLARHRWTRLSFVSLMATYGSYAFWRFHQVADTGAGGGFGMGVTFLAGYWVLFTVAVFIASREAMPGRERVAFLTANNGAFFAFAAQHFASYRPGTFWMFALGYGAVLLGLAALASRLRKDERSLDGACLAQGLALVTLGFAAKLTGPRLAVVLAVESATLLAGSRRRHGWLFEIAAGLCALGAAGLTLVEFAGHTASPRALGVPVAALLLFDAWWVKRLRGEMGCFSERALAFAALGFAVVAALIWRTVDAPWQAAVFALTACASIAAFRGRLPELGFPGSAFLLVGVGDFVAACSSAPPAPWWSPVPLVVSALALMHWWQFQKAVTIAAEARAFLELACAGAAVASGISWMHAASHGDAWLVATSAAAVGTLIYGIATRSWALALVGQIFSFIGAASFAVALIDRHPAWLAALVPVINFALTGLIAQRIAASRLPAPEVGISYAQIAGVYRVVALAMLGGWGFEYVGPEWRPAFFAGLGAAQILAGAATANRGRSASGGVYAAAGLALFWSRSALPVNAVELVAFLAIPASLRLGGRLAGGMPLPPAVRDPLVGAVVASVWLWVTRWMEFHAHAGQLTAAWAILALVIFAAGLGLRERIYRLGGFLVLALAVGRLFFVDVWRFDTLPRIVSFLVLGAVLLVLSFVYNRFAEAMRRWL